MYWFEWKNLQSDICTVGGKNYSITRVRGIKFKPNAMLWNIFSSHDLKVLYCFYNKHDMIKNGKQSGEKPQVLSQVLE